MRVPPEGRNDELVRTVIEAFGRLEGYVTPRCVWGRFHIIHFDGGIELEGAYIYSNDIARLTAQNDECYILAATLGHEVDRQISIAQQKNMLDGLALDACASVRIDAFADQFIKSEIAPGLREKEFLTSRFSPGYGDLPLELQPQILTALNGEKLLGVYATASHLLNPMKSVTAVIGLADKPQAAKIRGCGACALKGNCAYRERGISCVSAS